MERRRDGGEAACEADKTFSVLYFSKWKSRLENNWFRFSSTFIEICALFIFEILYNFQPQMSDVLQQFKLLKVSSDSFLRVFGMRKGQQWKESLLLQIAKAVVHEYSRLHLAVGKDSGNSVLNETCFKGDMKYESPGFFTKICFLEMLEKKLEKGLDVLYQSAVRYFIFDTLSEA